MDEKLLSVILKNSKLILLLPSNKKTAMTARELGEAAGIAQTTMYKRIHSLQNWKNLGVIEKPGLYNGGRPEQFYYKIHNFTISFKKGKISLIYYHK